MISYAILVSNEEEEFNRLITYLIRVKDENDEIVVLVDSSKTTDRIKTILLNNSSFIKYNENPLNNDFAAQKNLLFSMCSNPYIVNLDADEIIDEIFIKNVKNIITANPTVDAYWIPRWNEVIGLTPEHVQTMFRGWKLDAHNRINWPDLQMRVIKNIPEIKWTGVVHEQLAGYNTYAIMPLEREYSIIHKKTLEKQIQQNQFYNSIISK